MQTGMQTHREKTEWLGRTNAEERSVVEISDMHVHYLEENADILYLFLHWSKNCCSILLRKLQTHRH